MIKCVAGIIYYKKKYLFQIRDDNKNIFFPGFYGFFGGLVERREKPLNAVIREVFEELNIKPKKVKFLINFQITSHKFKQKRDRYYFIFYPQNNFKKKMILSEGAGFKFLTFSQIKNKKIIPWDIAALNYHEITIVKKKRIVPSVI